MIALTMAGVALGADVDGELDGELRYIGSLPPAVVIDARGTELSQGFVLDQRLRAGGSLDIGVLRLGTEWDLFTGQLAGGTWDLDTPDARNRDEHTALTLRGFVPREAMVRVRVAPFELQAGLVTSDWGLGMVANNGSRDPLFGRTDFGDRVIRVRLTTAPVPDLYITVAGDRVVEDDLAAIATGEQAWQGIASVLYTDESGRALGIYGVHRWQSEADPDRHTVANAIDLYGSLPVPLGDWTLSLATEAALLAGRTDLALTYGSPEGLNLMSAGVAVQASMAAPEDRATLHLRGGWASGDGDPNDGATNSFAFDPDYDAGMVLFDEFQGAIDVGTWGLLTDPEYSGTPPDGVDSLPSEGALRSAIYLQPAIEAGPTDWLTLKAGLVLAWATAPNAHPFYSFRSGGEARNHLDRPTQGYGLGTELDWGVGVGTDLGDGDHPIRPEVLLQGGHAFLSDDLVGEGPRRIDLVTATARLRW